MRTLWQRPEPSAGPPSNPAEIADRALHRRAIEAVIWGMPAVNFELMRRQMVKLGGAANQVVFWSRPVGWKNQTLTPNPDTIYFMPFFDTKDVGPVVLEIPPAGHRRSIVGSIDDCWQTAIEDVGPAGADKGAGGKYLILPPDYAGDVPDGYIAVAVTDLPGPMRCCARTIAAPTMPKSPTRSHTGNAFGYIRSRRRPIRRRPHSSMRSTTLFDATIPYDARFFDALNSIVQTEPWLVRDRAMIDKLKSIGIEKGKPSPPTTRRDGSSSSPRTRRTHGWMNRLEDVVLPAALLRWRPLACACLRRGRRRE